MTPYILIHPIAFWEVCTAAPGAYRKTTLSTDQMERGRTNIGIGFYLEEILEKSPTGIYRSYISDGSNGRK